MKRVIPSFLLFMLCLSASAQNFSLSDTGKRHWNKAQMYIKNGNTVFDDQQAIKELEALIQTDKYSEAYLELGKLYGKFNTIDKLRKSEEYFKLYSQCPGSKNIDAERDELAVKRELKRNAFQKALIGRWRHEKDINAMDDNGNPFSFGSCLFDFEIFLDEDLKLKAKVAKSTWYPGYEIKSWQEAEVLYHVNDATTRINYSFTILDLEDHTTTGPYQVKLEIPFQEVKDRIGVSWFYFTHERANYFRMTN